MDSYRVSYDHAAAAWSVGHVGGGGVSTDRLVLDVDAKMHLDGTFTCEGILRANDLVSVELKHARVEKLYIEREGDLPRGRVNHMLMQEWCVQFDQNSGFWVAYQHDDERSAITTKDLELGCHAISSEGVLHCKAQALVDGRSYAGGLVADAKHVRLRTLIVFDQKVDVDIIKWGAEAPAMP